jgi:hypothetical protein
MPASGRELYSRPMGPDAPPGGFVAGGYFIVRPATRSGSMSADLVPDRIITVSDCIADTAPDTWGIAWTVDPMDSRRDKAAAFGVHGADLDALIAWATAAFDSGRVGWPGMFLDLDAALDFRRTFLPAGIETAVVGIALPARLRDRFVEATRPAPGSGVPGVVHAVLACASPAEGGRPLGFDVLGWDCSGFHSYLCNGLEVEFERVLGVTPNATGFFDSQDDATRCAEHAGLDTTGAEPAVWLPWRMLAYD